MQNLANTTFKKMKSHSGFSNFHYMCDCGFVKSRRDKRARSLKSRTTEFKLLLAEIWPQLAAFYSFARAFNKFELLML